MEWSINNINYEKTETIELVNKIYVVFGYDGSEGNKANFKTMVVYLK